MTAFTPDHCANCDAALPFQPSKNVTLYCTEGCRQTAKVIRKARVAMANGKFFTNPDVRYGVQIALAHALAGGYAGKARRLPPEVKQAVRDQADGVCEQCQEQLGTEIDHIDGDSPELPNLQLLCARCHRAKTDLRMPPATPESRTRIEELWTMRVLVSEPARLCDSEEWNDMSTRLKQERRLRLGHVPKKSHHKILTCEEVTGTAVFGSLVALTLCGTPLRDGVCPTPERHQGDA
ncbi:5-methylcytosine-specific restriction endonuclease McrA [Kitasatospora gansuensis]|uniref:5-methylcytosine-specific restriction endonuclease McrA n=1 Tax=Kitasatospora gansuensis TaxID=258050 RepID=A0A7W7SIE3_9ACTN|nr:HNH endonuclease signature motif containing protein [Kitasatospora gansuensis]MBB4951020.1 5-methylcytosine-specific restriction endonuclease McrA [Kitasatospora gansuensis]